MNMLGEEGAGQWGLKTWNQAKAGLQLSPLPCLVGSFPALSCLLPFSTKESLFQVLLLGNRN